MNRKIAYSWIFLILLGFIATDFLENLFLLSCMWLGILILGNTIMFKYGWKQNRILCIYWMITLCLGTILSFIQYLSLVSENNQSFLPINHISTIWMVLLGINFIITTFTSKIYYFAVIGILMLIFALPVDTLKLSFPSITFGIIFSITLIGYVILSFLTPYEKFNVGNNYQKVNGIDEENFDHKIHKFKCSNCNYTYEGNKKLDYCPRCMASSDLLIDVD